MISFFKKFNIFERIKAYFIKIIKLAIFIVKRIFLSLSRSFLKFIQQARIQIKNLFKSKNTQVIKNFFNKIRNFIYSKFIKFFHSKKAKEKFLFLNFLESKNSKKIKNNKKEKTHSSQQTRNFCFIDCYENEFQNKKNFQFFRDCESNDFSNIQRFIEHYLFWLKFKKKQKEVTIEQGFDFLKIFDLVFEIIEYLFILMLQLIFFTIFVSCALCSQIIEKFFLINESFELFIDDLFYYINSYINFIEEKIEHLLKKCISKEFIFENFDCFMELDFMEFDLSL